MSWVVSGQVGPHAEPGYDGHGWLWELTQEGRPARRVFVQVAGTVWAVHAAGGPGIAPETVEAIATEGRSVVEEILTADEPPRMISCTTHGCSAIDA